MLNRIANTSNPPVIMAKKPAPKRKSAPAKKASPAKKKIAKKVRRALAPQQPYTIIATSRWCTCQSACLCTALIPLSRAVARREEGTAHAAKQEEGSAGKEGAGQQPARQAASSPCHRASAKGLSPVVGTACWPDPLLVPPQAIPKAKPAPKKGSAKKSPAKSVSEFVGSCIARSQSVVTACS